MNRLTQQEAKMLIDMLKNIAQGKVDFPSEKGRISPPLLAKSIDEKENFVIDMSRAGINANKATYQARHKRTNQILLRLDVNPTQRHPNPDGSMIEAGVNHLHIYTEEHGDRWAIAFDTENKELDEICYLFFDRFNIIERPEIIVDRQLRLPI